MGIKIITTTVDNEEDFSTHAVFDLDEIVIGRSPHSDLCIEDPTLSALHAKIFVSTDPSNGEQKLFLQDLGSSNGTSIDQRALRPFCEESFDSSQWIRLGKCLLKATLTGSHEAKQALNSLADQLAQQPTELSKSPEIASSSIAAQPIPLTNVEKSDEHAPATNGMACNNGKSAYSREIELTVDRDIHDLNFDAIRTAIISGRVIGQQGPLAKVQIDGGALGVTLTDDQGRFAFPAVPENTAYVIAINIPGMIFEQDRFSGVIEGDTSLEFRTKKTFSISGHVYYRNAPLQDVVIDGGALGKTQTDENGYYCFQNVLAGTTFSLSASKDGYILSRQGIAESVAKETSSDTAEISVRPGFFDHNSLPSWLRQ